MAVSRGRFSRGGLEARVGCQGVGRRHVGDALGLAEARIGRVGGDKEGNVVGNHVKVKVVKNKLAPPFRIAEFDIMYGEGIAKTGEIVDLGVDHDIIGKSGAWYSYDGAKIAQGREAAKRFFMDNPEVALEVEKKIKDRITGVEEDEVDPLTVEKAELATSENGVKE